MEAKVLPRMAQNEFGNWLREHTSLLESTIDSYTRVIRRFLEGYGEVTLDNINKFVSDSFRNKRSGYVKYAFREYLRAVGQYDLYGQVVKVRHKPRKKHGTFIPQEDLLRIVNKTNPEAYRIVAMIQMCTGARAHEVLAIKQADIKFNSKEKELMIVLITKGMKKQQKYIPVRFQKEIMIFTEKVNRQFPFLRGRYSGSMKKSQYNNYRYYYAAVKRAAISVGFPEFTTHDFRRNFAEALGKIGFRIQDIQKALGHSRIETTMKYMDESRETHKEAVKALWDQ